MTNEQALQKQLDEQRKALAVLIDDLMTALAKARTSLFFPDGQPAPVHSEPMKVKPADVNPFVLVDQLTWSHEEGKTSGKTYLLAAPVSNAHEKLEILNQLIAYIKSSRKPKVYVGTRMFWLMDEEHAVAMRELKRSLANK